MDEPFNPWVQFFDALDPMEVEITKLLGTGGQLEETELDVIARTHNAMGNAVMDSLNEKAQVHIGNSPVTWMGQPGLWRRNISRACEDILDLR